MKGPHGGGGSGASDGDRGLGGGNDRGGGVHRSGVSYRGSNVNPLSAAQMHHIAVKRLQHSAPNLGLDHGEAPPFPQHLDEDKRIIKHIASQLEARRQWKAVSGSSQTLNSFGVSPPFSYKEGHGASGAGILHFGVYSGKGSGSGGYYHGANQDSEPYQSQSGGGSLPELDPELDPDLELGYDEKPLAQTLDELENRYVQERDELTKDQNAEENKEIAKNRERLKEIRDKYQLKMTILRSKHAYVKQHEDFLRQEDDLENRYVQERDELTKAQNVEEGKEIAKNWERMKEIQDKYQLKMTILRSKHAKQREDFLRQEADICQHPYQQDAGYGMYQYGGSNGGSSSGIPPSRGGPYNCGGYDRGTHSSSPENLQGHGHLGVYKLQRYR